MQKKIIIIPKEETEIIERAMFEANMRQGVVDRYLDKHMNDTDESAINSKPFQYFLSLLAEAETTAELAKQELEDKYVKPILQDHLGSWELKYVTRELVITKTCDCEIEGWDD